MHQCVKCGATYEDGSEELLKGCSNCLGKFFLFSKKEETKEQLKSLSQEDKEKIEADVREIVGKQLEDDTPVILDLESINIKKPGQFEIDIRNLFDKEPLIYKMEDGKYIIDIASSFKKISRDKP
tara:strand:+ start:184 stop:558 length:375 start_codon:yes stop_codon:yes gene_type:complete